MADEGTIRGFIDFDHPCLNSFFFNSQNHLLEDLMMGKTGDRFFQGRSKRWTESDDHFLRIASYSSHPNFLQFHPHHFGGDGYRYLAWIFSLRKVDDPSLRLPF